MVNTGTRIQLSGANSNMNKLPSYFGGSNYDIYMFSTTITVTQPLLKNSFGQLDRYPFILAKFSDKLAKIKLAEDLEELQVTLKNEYLDWQFTFLASKIYKQQLQQAKKQVSLVNKQYKRGVSEKIDLIQAKQNLQAKKLAHLTSVQELKNKTIVINSRIGKIGFDNGIYPSKKIISTEIINQTEAVDYLTQQSNIQKLLKINEDMQQETLIKTHNLLDPSLDLIFTKTIGSTDSTSSEAIDNFGSNSPHSVGIQYSTPFGNTSAKAKYSAAIQKLEKIQMSNQNTIREMINTIKSLYSSIDSIDEQLFENNKLINLSGEYSDLEEKKYLQGRSSIFFLLNSQGQILSTKLRQLTLNMQKATLQNTLSGILDLNQVEEFNQ